MDIEKYIKEKGRGNNSYKLALRMNYEYHKDMAKKRLLELQPKAQEANWVSQGTWETLATCMIIHEILKEL